MTDVPVPAELWIFAYGSLIYRPDFPFEERRIAYVHGWTRRLWQGSPDHRGTPERPGRVATLVRAEGAVSGGCAYRIAVDLAPGILAALDAREQAGFERHDLALRDAPAGATFARGLVYVASPENPHYLGAMAEAEIAAWVDASHGPSGPNRDYVLRLHVALAELGIVDAHVGAVAARLTGTSTSAP